MRALALLLAVTSCTTTTKVTIKGDEIYRHLPELRTSGRADVAAQVYVDDKRKGDDTLETIDLDTRLILQERPRTLHDFAAGCNGKPPEGSPDESDEFLTEECYLKTYRADQFVLREDVKLNLGLAAKSTLAVLGIASYGIMANCAWNCEDETHRNVSFIGIGIVSALSIAFAIGKAYE